MNEATSSLTRADISSASKGDFTNDINPLYGPWLMNIEALHGIEWVI
jgi:hypothetical protein